MAAKAILAVAVVAGGVTIYQASSWWERAYATYSWSETSPDGCFRIDTYEPFWILPSMFHRRPDPDPAIRNDLGNSWEDAIFKRAYETRTGKILGETVVFDPSGPADFTDWGDTSKPGRRIVITNQFLLFDSSRCADEATLATLEAFYRSERETNLPTVKRWREQRRNADASSKSLQ